MPSPSSKSNYFLLQNFPNSRGSSSATLLLQPALPTSGRVFHFLLRTPNTPTNSRFFREPLDLFHFVVLFARCYCFTCFGGKLDCSENKLLIKQIDTRTHTISLASHTLPHTMSAHSGTDDGILPLLHTKHSSYDTQRWWVIHETRTVRLRASWHRPGRFRATVQPQRPDSSTERSIPRKIHRTTGPRPCSEGSKSSGRANLLHRRDSPSVVVDMG